MRAVARASLRSHVSVTRTAHAFATRCIIHNTCAVTAVRLHNWTVYVAPRLVRYSPITIRYSGWLLWLIPVAGKPLLPPPPPRPCRRFSIFIPRERRHWPARSNPGQFAGRAVLAESRCAAAGRMARRSWIYIVCLGENWFFMSDTWGYSAIHTSDDGSHTYACRLGARARGHMWLLSVAST